SFFFSSRRRHTRSKRDWSSDVCSSDLLLGEGVEPAVIARAFAGTEVTAEGERFLLQAGYTEETTPLWLLPDLYEAGMRQVGGQRSEERRVGEGGGGRGARQRLAETTKA